MNKPLFSVLGELGAFLACQLQVSLLWGFLLCWCRFCGGSVKHKRVSCLDGVNPPSFVVFGWPWQGDAHISLTLTNVVCPSCPLQFERAGNDELKHKMRGRVIAVEMQTMVLERVKLLPEEVEGRDEALTHLNSSFIPVGELFRKYTTKYKVCCPA